MPYALQSDLEAVLSESELIDLSDRGETGQVNAAKVAQAIADADAWINTYVAKQRTVPLDPVPPFIKRLAVQQAIYFLRSDRSATTEADDTAMLARQDYLTKVASGRVTLGVDPQPQKSALVSPANVVVDDADRERSAEKLKGFW